MLCKKNKKINSINDGKGKVRKYAEIATNEKLGQVLFFGECLGYIAA